MSKTQAPDPAREAFEARGQYKSKLLFKRGGSWAAEDVPPGDYVDGGVQRDWLLWQEAWKAATAAIQAPEGGDARPTVPQHVISLIAAYGDARADFEAGAKVDTATPLGKCVQAIRDLLAAPAQAPAEAHGLSEEIGTRITNLMLYADKLRDATGAETEEEGWANRLLHGLEALHVALSKPQPKGTDRDALQRLFTSYGNAMYRNDPDSAEAIAQRFSAVLAQHATQSPAPAPGASPAEKLDRLLWEAIDYAAAHPAGARDVDPRTWHHLLTYSTYTQAPATAQCTPALKRHALEAADRLAMYAAAPFFPDTEKRGVKRATTAEWWDGLAELIEEAQPLIKRGLHECTAPLADLQAPAVVDGAAIEEARRQLLNTPELRNFSEGVTLEALHQRERWGAEHDHGKAPADWFWLVGYLAGKALHAQTSGNVEKALHHTISTAAALANWHAAITGEHTAMRPGIDPAAHGIAESHVPVQHKEGE